MMELVMLVLLLLVVQIDAYRNFSPISRSSVLKMAAEDAADRARLTLVIAGPSIGNALFRAELKKELTFFRGCSAQFLLNSDESLGTIVAEGKREQLDRFMGWIGVLCSDLISRKPNFQGPSLIIELLSQKWDAYDGSLAKGFYASKEAPEISDQPTGEKEYEAKSMTGTDESV